jgi:Ser/Thr protein kinase RdoA (MazF antagonist)
LKDISTTNKWYAIFEYLADKLPKRFLPAVTEVQAPLPALIDECYPVVLTHSDLNETNILVDPSSGKITGIVDWSGASIQPFGFTLYALENALGSMGPDGWKWFDDADDLRDAFWMAFKGQTGLSESQTTLIKLAGKAGILIRYGTAYDSVLAGTIGVRDPSNEDFKYLDGLLF